MCPRAVSGLAASTVYLTLAFLGFLSLATASTLPNIDGREEAEIAAAKESTISATWTEAVPPKYTGVPTATVVRTVMQTGWHAQEWIEPRRYELRTTATATSLQPGPFAPSVLPTTATQWVVSTLTHETRVSFYANDGALAAATVTWDTLHPPPPGWTTWAPLSVITAWDSEVVTAPETYGVYAAAPSYLPAGPPPPPEASGSPPVLVPCGDAERQKAQESTVPEPDPLCVEQRLNTGCQGQQCDVRGGELWCLQRWYGIREMQPAMGRACWGGDGRFIQLLKPCHRGDTMVGCNKNGRSGTWGDRVWEGPGSSGNPFV